MKLFIVYLLALLVLFPGLTSCNTDNPELPSQTEYPAVPDTSVTPDDPDNDDNNNSMDHKLKITIGTIFFGVTLENNTAATAFKALLPITMNMYELNGNEKFYNLSASLPAAASHADIIRTGDLMLYGSNCVVLFYETFSSSYSYTRLGHTDNPSGLADALGSGSVTVKFETADNKNK